MKTALALILCASPAVAQQCAPHEVVTANLAERYGETPRMIGIDSRGAMIEVWGNPETGTWTLTVTNPSGPTCMIAAGEALEMVRARPPGVDG